MLSHCSDYDQQWGRIESDEVSARTFGRAVQIFQGIRYDSYLYSPYVSIIFIFFFLFFYLSLQPIPHSSEQAALCTGKQY